jgi:hypothetical protein
MNPTTTPTRQISQQTFAGARAGAMRGVPA